MLVVLRRTRKPLLAELAVVPHSWYWSTKLFVDPLSTLWRIPVVPNHVELLRLTPLKPLWPLVTCTHQRTHLNIVGCLDVGVRVPPQPLEGLVADLRGCLNHAYLPSHARTSLHLNDT